MEYKDDDCCGPCPFALKMANVKTKPIDPYSY